MRIGLWTKTPNQIVGCKKVVDNLKKGFNELHQEYVENQIGDVNGCIHGGVLALQRLELPEKTLIGPEIMVLPSENQSYWLKYDNWCQPSRWVVDYMKEFRETRTANFYVWPTGIDTEEFKPQPKIDEYDCFIYYKNVTKQTPVYKLDAVKKYLDNRGLKYNVIIYGQYQERQLKDLCQRSKFAIFLTGTESQGIAYMEVLASGVPIFVFEEKEFSYYGYKFTNKNVSAAPYFDERCGAKAFDLSDLDHYFLDNLNNFKPRDYIMENHTCAKGAQKYIDILKDCHGCN